MLKEGQVTDKTFCYVITNEQNELLGVDECGADVFVSGSDPFAANVTKFEKNKDARVFLKSLKNVNITGCKLWRVHLQYKRKVVELKNY